MRFEPGGLATGIGSLPMPDRTEAVGLVKKYLPYIPHWPQLPKSDYREFYLWQFFQLLQDLGLLRVKGQTAASFANDQPEWPERLTSFYDIYLRAEAGDEDAWRRFAFPPGSAEGFSALIDDLRQNGTGAAQWLKGEVVGLLTAGFQITDSEQRPAYYDSQLRDILLKQLSLQAAWQVKEFRRFGLSSLIFMDDPVIDSCGRYDRINVSKEEVIAELDQFADCVRSYGGLAGVHSCADLDWSLLLTADLDIVSFDAYQFGDSFSLFHDKIAEFLQRGGVIAWGIVPTDGGLLAEETEDSLVRRMREQLWHLKNKGIDPALLQSQSLLTPACGAGTLSIPEARRIYQLTALLASRWSEICAAL